VLVRGVLAATLASASAVVLAQGRSLSFVEPKDGATVTSPFRVKLAVVGMEVAKAGALVPNSGHHVLIVNGGPVSEGQAIPADPTHLHWGKGQTEQKIRLPAGQYKLTAQFADGVHHSYGPALSQTITVTVK
jgi:hypothetical protein